MILIFSLFNDSATIDVCKWLSRHKADFLVVENFEDFNSFISQTGNIDKVKTIWYRKLLDVKLSDNELINNFLTAEQAIYLDYLEEKLSSIKSLGAGFSKMDLNKLRVLKLANDCQLNVPDYLITTTKRELVDFLKMHHKVITKPLSNPISYYYKGALKPMYTSLIEDLEKVKATFFPSLFQKYISKKFELRIFYLEGEFFSSVILSQMKEFTIDIRESKNSRIIPFNLPIEIKNKLHYLMLKIGLNTGSIDMIYSDDHMYYFLEINPCGIFDGIANESNFLINKKIAEWLMS